MDKLLITGGVELHGEVVISGSKNSALPALAACLLTEEPVTLRRVPSVRDLRTMQDLIEATGASIDRNSDGSITVTAKRIDRPEAPYELVKTMRASSLWDPLESTCRHASLSIL